MSELRRDRKIQLHWKNYKNKRKWVASAVREYVCKPTWIWNESTMAMMRELRDFTRRQRRLFARMQKRVRREVADRKKRYLETEKENKLNNSTDMKKTFELKLPREWYEKMAEIEDGCEIGVGGLAVDLGLYKTNPVPSNEDS